jgi:hypothetical protein
MNLSSATHIKSGAALEQWNMQPKTLDERPGRSMTSTN